MQQEPSNTPQMFTQPDTLQQQPKPKKRRKALIIAVVMAVVVLLVAVGVFLANQNNLPKTNSKVINSIGATPSADQIASIDKTEAFFGYFKNAAQQQKLVITKVESGADSAEKLASAQQAYTKTGIDYAAGTYKIAMEDHQNGEVRQQIRCYDGASWIPKSRRNLDQWTSYTGTELIYHCKKDKRQDKFNDGVNTGGLTAAQADTFIGTLRDQPGLITVRSLELAKHSNKDYLHFTVDLTPAPGPSGYLKFGGGWLMMAFRETGLDPTTYPYGYHGSEGHGFTFNYYVDPSTKLPAYSEINPLKEDQEKSESTAVTVYKNRYQFGTADFDVTTSNTKPLTFDW